MPDRETAAAVAAEERVLKRAATGQISFWEQAVAVVATALVVGLLGYLIWQALTHDDAAPAISFRIGTVEQQPEGFLVRFEAVNKGGSTASAVEIVGQLSQGDATREESRVTIDYLPAHSLSRGGLWFRQDPRQHELRIRAIGYVEP